MRNTNRYNQYNIQSTYLGEGYEEEMEEQPSSHRLAQSMGVSAQNMQVMKASFFHEEDVPQQPGKVPGYIGSN